MIFGKARRHSGQLGHSLMEMMMVSLIIMLMAAMTVPVVGAITRQMKLQSATKAVSGAIQGARHRAMAASTPYRLTFSKSGSYYKLAHCTNCDSTVAAGTYVTVDTNDVEREATIPFSVPGGPVLSADVTMYLRPGGAIQKTESLTVNCGTSEQPKLILTYNGKTETITVGCYGKVTATP